MKNTTNLSNDYSQEEGGSTGAEGKTQVLVVLSDNGIEEIPFVAFGGKENDVSLLPFINPIMV